MCPRVTPRSRHHDARARTSRLRRSRRQARQLRAVRARAAGAVQRLAVKRNAARRARCRRGTRGDGFMRRPTMATGWCARERVSTRSGAARAFDGAVVMREAARRLGRLPAARSHRFLRRPAMPASALGQAGGGLTVGPFSTGPCQIVAAVREPAGGALSEAAAGGDRFLRRTTTRLSERERRSGEDRQKNETHVRAPFLSELPAPTSTGSHWKTGHARDA